ncbi:MAG: methylmalonyl Co-A mutase-associated GTPase MeaB [Arenicellales bacterium]
MSVGEALAQAIEKKDRRALAQAITLVESAQPAHRADADALMAHLKSPPETAFRIGITGPPGAGKSTLIEAMGQRLIGEGHRLAVLTIDPSSRISGGSILGDKTRMPTLSADPKAFVRPSPSSGIEGGVSRHTQEAILLCEACGFDRVLVETVGVGQSELRVAQMTDVFVLLLAPSAGDELQGIKRGVMELADVILINKSDGDLRAAAQRAAAECLASTGLMKTQTPDWTVPVLNISALEGDGIAQALSELERFHQHLKDRGLIDLRRRHQASEALTTSIQEALYDAATGDPNLNRELDQVRKLVLSGNLTPRLAAARFVDQFTARIGKSNDRTT